MEKDESKWGNDLRGLDVRAYDHAPHDHGHGSVIRGYYHKNENGD